MDAIDPLPYYAGLAKVLHGPTLALVLTYLEFEYPAPQEPSDGHPGAQNEPVMLDCDSACTALGVSRRTLHVALSCLGVLWSTEDGRSRAARVDREFLNPDHSRFDPVKLYSFTGSKAYTEPERKLAMRRNIPKLDAVLTLAGILPTLGSQTRDMQHVDISARCHSPRKLPVILHSVLPNWGDRRSERWDRWRRETGRKSQNPGRMRTIKEVDEIID